MTWANAGLELMAWVYLVRDGDMVEREFQDHGARTKTFKELLQRVSVPTDRVPELLPALRKAGDLGPDAIWAHRKKFVHPRDGRIDIDYDELVDSWRLAVHYLELVLLHWFGHQGHYASRLEAPRWVGSVLPVPWKLEAI